MTPRSPLNIPLHAGQTLCVLSILVGLVWVVDIGVSLLLLVGIRYGSSISWVCCAGELAGRGLVLDGSLK